MPSFRWMGTPRNAKLTLHTLATIAAVTAPPFDALLRTRVLRSNRFTGAIKVSKAVYISQSYFRLHEHCVH